MSNLLFDKHHYLDLLFHFRADNNHCVPMSKALQIVYMLKHGDHFHRRSLQLPKNSLKVYD